MKSYEKNNLAFVIRIWSEEHEPGKKRIWRGRIVSAHDDHDYLYFNHLCDLIRFIVTRMLRVQLSVSWCARIIARRFRR